MSTDTTQTSKYFLVCAGGTGMRCLQSFVNMCALGMFSGQIVDLLLLDTDAENKDKKNAENLVQKYKSLMNNYGEAKHDKAGEFFSTQINLYSFVPDYSKDTSKQFTLLSEMLKGDPKVNKRLGDLMYDEPVQEFNLAHGYRGQTHLGSYLMYHAFIDEIRKANADDKYKSSSELYKFIDRIKDANNEGEARIFSMGSTFGGTGASSIPVMPVAITDAAKIITGGKVDLSNLNYGATILGNYFTFPSPSQSHKKKEGIVCDSQFFPYNAALSQMYYIKDPSILETYKRFYFLGWGEFSKVNTEDYKNKISGVKSSKTITGGKDQENPAHLLEFMCAFAAKHFYETGKVEDLKQISKTQMKFKGLGFASKGDDKIPMVHFEDLVTYPAESGEKGIDEQFRANLYALYAFSSMLQERYSGNVENFLSDLNKYNSTYELSDEEIESLGYFLSYFSVSTDTIDGKEKNIPGWFSQIWHSLNEAPDGTFLGINPRVFGGQNEKMWMPEWSYLYKETSENNQWDQFIKTFKKKNGNKKDANLSDLLSDVRLAFHSMTHIIVDPEAKKKKIENAEEVQA